jgi:hypothetical protein
LAARILGAVAADPSPPSSPIVSHEYQLPSARQVVGRGLQLALDGSADIRRTSLYIGLLVAGVAAPAAVLLLANLPTLLALPWDDPMTMSQDQARALDALFGPLYSAVALALLGIVTVLVDGQLMAAALLAGRLAGAPLTMREALARSRQVFWRYGAAAFAVGLLSGATNLVVSLLTGTFGRGESIGSSLLATFVAAIVTAPFGYVLMGVVAGDVSAGTALRRSVAPPALGRPSPPPLPRSRLLVDPHDPRDRGRRRRRRRHRAVASGIGSDWRPSFHPDHDRGVHRVRQPVGHRRRDRGRAAGRGIPRADALRRGPRSGEIDAAGRAGSDWIAHLGDAARDPAGPMGDDPDGRPHRCRGAPGRQRPRGRAVIARQSSPSSSSRSSSMPR